MMGGISIWLGFPSVVASRSAFLSALQRVGANGLGPDDSEQTPFELAMVQAAGSEAMECAWPCIESEHAFLIRQDRRDIGTDNC